MARGSVLGSFTTIFAPACRPHMICDFPKFYKSQAHTEEDQIVDLVTPPRVPAAFLGGILPKARLGAYALGKNFRRNRIPARVSGRFFGQAILVLSPAGQKLPHGNAKKFRAIFYAQRHPEA